MSPSRDLCLHLEGVGLDIGGRHVLDGVHLAVTAGEMVAVTGPSGSGKTVLCLLLAGALAPSRGRLYVRGPASDEVARASRRRPTNAVTTSLILQVHGLVSGLTAEENVALPLQSRGVARETSARRTADALADVGLARHAARLVDELSGGERQRVGIARALASDPAILVADEPTAELDPGNRARVMELLTALAADDRIVVVASDDPEVEESCARSVALDAGRIVEGPVPVTRVDST